MSNSQRTQESLKRSEALLIYQQAFNDGCLKLQDGWIQRFIEMWESDPEEETSLVTRPPCGWAEFNERLGGLPWEGYWSHVPGSGVK